MKFNFETFASKLAPLLAICFLLAINSSFISGQRTSNNRDNQRASNQQVGFNTQASAAALGSTTAGSGIELSSGQQGGRRNQDSNSNNPGSSDQDDLEDDEQAMTSKPEGASSKPKEPKRKPSSTRRPRMRTSSMKPMDNEDDDDCEDEDYDYNRKMYSMATNPMRQFSRIWDRVFRQMRPDDEGNFEDGRGALATASSFSDGQTTRMASATLDSDGRARGILSETRNGKTKTRRFGDAVDEDTDSTDEDEY